MKKFSSFFFSMFFTGLLVVIFAISIAYATFIENDYGTVTAKILVYNAKWFEILLFIMCVNLIGSIFTNKLIAKKRYPGVLLHFSFVVIFIGAAITRYYGYEGSMHIREGESSNTIISEPTFISIKAKKGDQTEIREKQVLFSPYTANRFSENINIGGQQIKVENTGYLPSAEEVLVADPNGSPVLSLLTVANGSDRKDFLLQPGETKKIGAITLGFEIPENNTDINFHLKNGALFVTTSDTITVLEMMGQEPQVIAPDMSTEINTQKAYSLGNVSFAVKQYFTKGISKLNYVQPENGVANKDAIQAEITVGNTTRIINVFGAKGELGEEYSTSIDGVDISIGYGSKLIEIPFSIYLNDFQLERYPGSNSPSSYASEVVLKDQNTEKPFRIYMNNILKYNGFRFFQSSYDRDEKGTILSVNHDSLGTSVTYIGYLLMAIGMVLIFFNKNSRIKALIKTSAKLREERKKFFAILVFGLFFGINAGAQNTQYNKDHVSEFGKMLVQSAQGRVEPVNTLASEILRKVARKNSWQGMSSTEVYLDMQVNPEKWKDIPIIKVANSDLKKLLNANGNYVSFNSMFNPVSGEYKLNQLVAATYEKKPNERNKFDKEIINVDERANIMMEVFQGDFLTILPVPGHDNHKWISLKESNLLGSEGEAFARNTIGNYFSSVQRNDWATATTLLNQLKNYQQTQGAKIIPSATKINFEVIYNNLDIFGKLSKIYMLLGLILLAMNLTTIFNPKFKLTGLKKISLAVIFILFLVHTTGLGIRWYISDHAPWSNGYESMVFISWATCLAGLIFANRSEITLSTTTLLAGLSLMVAGFSWMSPEITNLVPVLKSYWLIVHVAVITSSYGFLGVGALLAMINLILMISRNKTNMARVNFTIRELVNIIEIALLIGLIMVTLGSFLGGVWANESWGRYWGWDPKETWALVTILVYTFISHMHKIPGFKGNYAVSVAALVGFSSVLMTYFGVNYYLSGLHSYAQGEPAPVPT
ncbi:MAG TPA: cytochrome c biogenesis protein CcsA, partial [Draconibacterium sp.]|nr:cytochrome c biogenesis protein CcsA [Draconibacterium sp.]